MRNRVFLAGLLCAAPAFAAEQGPLTVLQVLDLSGQNGDTGKDFLTGAKVYFDYINTHGGVNGRKITHVVADDKGIAENTLALTRQLVAESRPAVLFGYMGADNVDTVLADDQLHPAGLALVGPYSGAGRNRWPNLFPVKAGPADEVRRILRMATSLGISRIGLFHGVDTLGKAARTTVDQELAAKGYAPATRAVFHAAINIGDAAEHMAAKQPQAVILAAPTLASAQFVRELRARLPGTQFFALSSVNHQTMLEFLGPQAAQGVVDGTADALGPAAQAAGLHAVLREREPELGGDLHLVPHRLEGLAEDVLVGERPVHLGSVEEGDAQLDGTPDQRDGVRPGGSSGGAVRAGQAHAAQPDLRDCQAIAQGSSLHGVPSVVSP